MCDWCNAGPVVVVYQNGWDHDADYGVCVACDAELTRLRTTREPEWVACVQCGMRYPEDAGVRSDRGGASPVPGESLRVGPGACAACLNNAA